MTADHTPKRLHVRCAPMVWWQEIMLLHERLPLDAHYGMVIKFAVTFFPVLTT
jgi:hypothetical protein